MIETTIHLLSRDISPRTQFVLIIHNQLERMTLNFLHLNIRSANKNFEQLSLFLDNIIKSRLFCDRLDRNLVYGWPTYYMYVLPIYRHNLIFNYNRVNRRGGGVAMYVPTHLHYIILDELNTMNQTMESVFIEIIFLEKKRKILWARSPSSDNNAIFTLEIHNNYYLTHYFQINIAI